MLLLWCSILCRFCCYLARIITDSPLSISFKILLLVLVSSSLSARFLPLTHSIYWSRNDKSPARRLKTRDCGARNTFIAVRWKKILKLITFFPPIASLPVWHKNGTPVDGLMISLSCVSGLQWHTIHNEWWFVSILSSTHKILFISLTRGAEKTKKIPTNHRFVQLTQGFLLFPTIFLTTT